MPRAGGRRWADAYTNAVPRLLEHLAVPRLGLIGPWAHIYPQDGVPGPAIDFLGEVTRWWDTWLKGIDTGMMRGPVLRAFVEDWRPPTTSLAASAGRFVAEPSWPSPLIDKMVWHCGDGSLSLAPAPGVTRSIRSPLWTGMAGGDWMGCGVAGEMPADQRADDGLSLCFETAPLAERLEILGVPRLRFRVSADKPQAQVAVRLCDVAPDGTSLRVSYGVLNLAHRNGAAQPRPLVPGETVEVDLALDACGHAFPPGHRLRVAVSTSYWPLLWPARDHATLTIQTAGSTLLLPVRTGSAEAVPFPPPRHGPLAPQIRLRAGVIERTATLDAVSGVATTVVRAEGGLFGEGVVRFDDIGTALSHDMVRTHTVASDDPMSATATITQRYVLSRPDGIFATETETALTADREAFRITGTMRVFEDDRPVFERSWDERIERDNL